METRTSTTNNLSTSHGLFKPESFVFRNPERLLDADGAHRAQDALTRLRDKWGNRLPWFYSHSVPLVEDVPLAHTALASALSRIVSVLPLVGGELEHFYDHKLRPALRRLIAVTDTELNQVEGWNARVELFENALDAEDEEINREDREALAALEPELEHAHTIAAEKVAATGGHYDPNHPTPDAALRLAREDEGALAAHLALPWTPSDTHALLPSPLGWGVTVVVGAMIGASLGILSGLVPVGNPLGRPALFAFFEVAGVAAAIGGKFAVKHAAREASLRYWLGRPLGNWLPLTIISLVTALALLTIDSLVEREGLMASLRLRDLAGQLTGAHSTSEAKQGLYFLMAIIVTFGYVLNAWWEGWLSGRFDACRNRIYQEGEVRFIVADRERRALPEVQVALEAIGRVQRILADCTRREERVASRTAALDAQRLTRQESLDEAARKRIQDAYDQLCGTLCLFDGIFV